ncbi:hypothetical protein BH24GEM2_BH24GEM2_14130 [soil metagenome]
MSLRDDLLAVGRGDEVPPRPRYRLGPVVSRTAVCWRRDSPPQSAEEWEAAYLAGLPTMEQVEAELVAELVELESEF